ncbi:hypothetical protein BJX70DRAFT_395249 [Aspergillus crustosus]
MARLEKAQYKQEATKNSRSSPPHTPYLDCSEEPSSLVIFSHQIYLSPCKLRYVRDNGPNTATAQAKSNGCPHPPGGPPIHAPETKKPALVPLPKYLNSLRGMVEFMRDGIGEGGWVDNPDTLGLYFQYLTSSTSHWVNTYLISGLGQLAPEQIRTLIARLDGLCLQLEWDELRPQLPPAVCKPFGNTLGRLLLYLTLYERIFEHPFWYFDEKEGPDNEEGDLSFARKLHYIFERGYDSNDAFRALWKSHTQRLANPVGTVGNYSKRLRYDEEQRDGFNSGTVAAQRRKELAEAFENGHQLMVACETVTNGWPVLRGIEDLRKIYNGDSKVIELDGYGWHHHTELYNGQKILVGTRPGLVYVGGIAQNQPAVWSRKATEVMAAQVLPVYVPPQDEEANNSEQDERSEGGDHNANDEASNEAYKNADKVAANKTETEGSGGKQEAQGEGSRKDQVKGRLTEQRKRTAMAAHNRVTEPGRPEFCLETVEIY